MHIPIYNPSLTGNEKKYVNECLDSTWISSKGEFIHRFEERFAAYIDAQYVTSVSNGTVALHLALEALGIGAGDEVIVPTLTYIASVNAITYTGAKPVFVDSTHAAWQLDCIDLEKKITPRTKAIMVVHLYGHPCEMNKIMEISKKYGLFVIEDCAESFGSIYHNQFTGTFGDVATFSFYGNKTITTGEGGMVVCKHKDVHQKVQKLKGQGLSDHREYWHDIIGYNYRMTNICAAIGLAQLEQADVFLDKKRKLAAFYKSKFQHLPIKCHEELENTVHSYWMFSILVEDEKERDPLREYLKNRGVETRPVFYPIHLMPMYYSEKEDYPVATNIGARGINLPSWPGLSQAELEYVVQQIEQFFG